MMRSCVLIDCIYQYHKLLQTRIVRFEVCFLSAVVFDSGLATVTHNYLADKVKNGNYSILFGVTIGSMKIKFVYFFRF